MTPADRWRLRHRVDAADLAILWDTVALGLPDLRASLLAALQANPVAD